MPIRLLEDFPAKNVLEQESIMAIDNERAEHQDIRPLKLLILNLMPNKIDTEIHFLRLISKTPLQVDVDFLKMESHVSKNTSMSHLAKFYLIFDQVKANRYDGMIVTGAPIEQLPFEEVDYWHELCKVFKWSKEHVFSTIHVCWGAQAGLYFHHNINKIHYKEKLFGIYPQVSVNKHPVVDGFDDIFNTPQSRYTGIDEEQLVNHKNLTVLSKSTISGTNMLTSKDGRQIFILGHLEYDVDTLANEYRRDIEKGLNIQVPYNYFRKDDPTLKPLYTWKAHARLLYHNWLNYVYQQTPYDLNELK